MYTQCEHCKAVFRVNMRQATIAKGKLRCGECLKVFNASENMSTTIPEKYQLLPPSYIKTASAEEMKLVETFDEWQSTPVSPSSNDIKNRKKQTVKKVVVDRNRSENKVKKVIPAKSNTLLVIFTLIFLLIAQVLYNYRHPLLNLPQHQPEKIQMLNHNVFVHPNETGALLITATIENTAEHSQPYPVLELSLKDAKSATIALRRFMPQEYLDNYTKEMLIEPKKAKRLILKIKDPGKKATRFQFVFL